MQQNLQKGVCPLSSGGPIGHCLVGVLAYIHIGGRQLLESLVQVLLPLTIICMSEPSAALHAWWAIIYLHNRH